MAIKLRDILTVFDEGTNIADFISEKDRKEIARVVIEDYKRDKQSRLSWETKIDEGMKLALQIYEAKNTPWPNASNVKFPLITVPCLQFSSRVYPALISGTDIVKMRVVGDDPTGQKTARSQRVSTHMSYQVLEKDQDWEKETDVMLTTMPLVGCGFKKSYFDPQKEHNCSKNVFAKDLVINYYAKSLESASCITHVFTEYRNEIEEKMRLGIYQEHKLTESHYQPDLLDSKRDERVGVTPPADGERPYQILEQHRYLDLDDDGYAEPYVVHVNKETEDVVRIFPRFASENLTYVKGKVARIRPIHYFTKYTFIPSPDGSIYDLGFFSLLGPINESVNTLINQLIDNGTLRIRGGGFIGRGARIKGGALKFTIGEWKQVNVSGDDLAKSFFPIPVTDPPIALFNLLSMLIEYGERISSVSDMMIGKTPGQNTPATTSMAALEQGEKVFTGIFKRVYRSMKEEFQKLYYLNQIYMNEEEYYQVLDTGQEARVYRADYMGDPTDIKPTADPSVVSSTQRLMKAEALRAAASTYWGYKRHKIERRYLEAMQIPAIDEVLMPEDEQGNGPPPPPDPKMENDRMKIEVTGQIEGEKIRQGDEKLRLDAIKTDGDYMVMETTALLNLAKAKSENATTEVAALEKELALISERREWMKTLMEKNISEKELELKEVELEIKEDELEIKRKDIEVRRKEAKVAKPNQ